MLKLDLQVIVTSNIFFMKTFEIEISSHQLQLITFSLERATKQVFFSRDSDLTTSVVRQYVRTYVRHQAPKAAINRQ